MTTLSDEDVVRRIRLGETALFEVLMRRYNQRIYRAVRAILRDDADAEDVMQQAYLNAYRHLDQFAERAKFSTWLTKIAVYEALHRVRRRRPMTSLDEAMPDGPGDNEGVEGTTMDTIKSPGPNPEQALLAGETASLLEAAVTGLPDGLRDVFMLRDVDGLSTLETAESLGIKEETVKTRLHRARRHLRRHLSTSIESAAPATFQFHAVRCDRVVAHVMKALRDTPAFDTLSPDAH
jgi:RNA polymerase sigma-70 factor (ECF subfamily)